MPKSNIHPTYYPNATVTCSCGATHTIGSTRESLKVDICSECHPFYTGNQKLIDTAGRVDRFREKMAQAEALRQKSAKPQVAVESKPEVKEEESVETAAAEEVAVVAEEQEEQGEE